MLPRADDSADLDLDPRISSNELGALNARPPRPSMVADPPTLPEPLAVKEAPITSLVKLEVVVKDLLPLGVKWQNFGRQRPFKVSAGLHPV